MFQSAYYLIPAASIYYCDSNYCQASSVFAQPIAVDLHRRGNASSSPRDLSIHDNVLSFPNMSTGQTTSVTYGGPLTLHERAGDRVTYIVKQLDNVHYAHITRRPNPINSNNYDLNLHLSATPSPDHSVFRHDSVRTGPDNYNMLLPVPQPPLLTHPKAPTSPGASS